MKVMNLSSPMHIQLVHEVIISLNDNSFKNETVYSRVPGETQCDTVLAAG